MLTMTTEGRQPVLGNLTWTVGKPEDARVERTPLGEEAAEGKQDIDAERRHAKMIKWA